MKRQEKFGHYFCDGLRFETKIKAMIHGNDRGGLPITWDFNTRAFSAFDWTVEPTQSLDTLYDQRSRQIREQYDYVILSYSGGADSNNILESFLRQGLHIDEIITNWALDITEDYLNLSGAERSAWNMNAEFKLNVVNRLQYIQNKSPRTKITVLDTSKSLIDGLLSKKDPSWVEDRNDSLNITGVSHYNIAYFTEVRKRFDKFQRVAYVLGIDKPRVRVIDNKLYTFFIDKAVNQIPIDEHLQEHPNATALLYYWDTLALPIMVKQAHIILKHIRADARLKSIFESTDFGTQRHLHEELLKHVLYPSTWSSDYWQAKKPIADWDCELDYWFTRGCRNTPEYELWLSGMKELIPKIHRYITKNKDGTVNGTIALTSKFYYVGDVIQAS